jgi:hypothetical protein
LAAAKQFTKLSIRIEAGQTKHKRPILFLVPARTELLQVLDYSVHGRDRGLFGLKPHVDGIWALYYRKAVSTTSNPQDGPRVIHHVRVVGRKSRHVREHSEAAAAAGDNDLNSSRELNMKVRIVVK